MSISQRADIHRMATKIALSYARSHNETFDAFPQLFRTAYHGLLSCTEPPQDAAVPARRTAGPAKPAAPARTAAPPRPAPARVTAPPKPQAAAKPQRAGTNGTGRGRPTWTPANALGKTGTRR
ncbi:hypothetical protein JL100_004110 [Skermanella mucosa]|uniref:hypothetical protein n=1 Tax=Skermanella mucosa TaxID=1789672 RepID=UPI00192A98EF|nr:hypothetical protein [Skermanella mucosa]UEM21959.1 hypothetical protein JL100_004110 [Skermanella mucosa]